MGLRRLPFLMLREQLGQKISRSKLSLPQLANAPGFTGGIGLKVQSELLYTSARHEKLIVAIAQAPEICLFCCDDLGRYRVGLIEHVANSFDLVELGNPKIGDERVDR